MNVNVFIVQNILRCNDQYGMHGVIPHRGLHKFEKGKCEIAMPRVVDMITIKNKDRGNKNELNKLHHMSCKRMNRQLERDFILCSMIGSGIICKTKMVETGKLANLLLTLIIVIKTMTRQETFSRNDAKISCH